MPINLNGILQSDNQPIFTAENRAFRFGDGLFESIRVFEGRLPFFHRHWERLSAGTALLKMELPGHFSPDFFEDEIAKLTKRQGNWRIRMTVWRSGGGLYSPETMLPEFLIQATPLPDSNFVLNVRGLTIGTATTVRLPTAPSPKESANHTITSFKTTSSLSFVLAAIYKQENQLDDCLLLNTAGRLACASSANIFLVKNGALLTPPLTEGCVAGTMRAEVISIAKSLKIKVVEKRLPPSTMANADEVFLTNAVQGLRWVGQLVGQEKKYENDTARQLMNELNQRIQ